MCRQVRFSVAARPLATEDIMGRQIEVTRLDLSAAKLRRVASRSPDGRVACRILAIAHVLEGSSRADAAAACGMDRQTLRDLGHRYNHASLTRRGGLRHRRTRVAAPRTALVRWSGYKDLDTASGDTGRLRHSWRHTGLHASAGEEVRCRSAFVVSAATRSEVDQSHYYSVPDGPSPAPREDLEQGIVNVPTPGRLGRVARPPR